jgi:hypothetical protein
MRRFAHRQRCPAAPCAALELRPFVSTRQPRWTPRRLEGTRGDARGTHGVLTGYSRCSQPPILVAGHGGWRCASDHASEEEQGYSRGTRAASTRQLCVYEWRGGADQRVREPGTAGVLAGYSTGTMSTHQRVRRDGVDREGRTERQAAHALRAARQRYAVSR